MNNKYIYLKMYNYVNIQIILFNYNFNLYNKIIIFKMENNYYNNYIIHFYKHNKMKQ